MRIRLLFLLGILLGAALSVSVQGYAKANTKEIPVDYVHQGYEPEYIHGDHCVDGRVF
jgi:hypothetical protein